MFLPSSLSTHTFRTWTDGRRKKTYKNQFEPKFQAEDVNLLEPSSAGSDAILDTVRIARETNNLNNNQNNQINHDQEPQASENKDQQAAAAENASSSIDELTLDSIEDDENRGKRFVFMIDEGKCHWRPN